MPLQCLWRDSVTLISTLLLTYLLTRSMSSSPLLNSLVKNRLFKTAPEIDEAPFQFIHTGFVCGRHDAAWQPRSRKPQDWDLGCLEATAWTQESLPFLDAAVQLLHVHGTVCRCTVLLEHKVITRHCVSLAAVWRCYDVVKQHWRSQQTISPAFCAL